MARVAILLLAHILTSSASASLSVFPTRAVITDKLKVVNLTLRHVGDKPRGYKVSLEFYPMNTNGSLGDAKAPTRADRAAIGLLRFSPKRTMLEPNIDQTVRVMKAGSKDLPDGDYRAHLLFKAQPSIDTASEREVAQGDVSANVEPLVSVAIPVIYRKGNPTYDVKLANPKPTITGDKKAALAIDISSGSKYFPYGELLVFFQPAAGGEEKQVGFIKGISVYVPKITMTIPLISSPTPGGKLRVEFRESSEDNPMQFAKLESKT